jgi:dTMP kinase
LAERLRTLILAGKAKNLGPEAEAMFFAAARADHVDHLIRPALQAGKWVLSDRFADSTRVYQGVTGAVPPALIDLLETVALDGMKPDLTLVLDLPVEEGLARAGARRGDAAVDRFEGEDMSVQEARRQGFLAIAAQDPARVAVIDAAAAPDIVALRVRAVVSERLGVDFGMI